MVGHKLSQNIMGARASSSNSQIMSNQAKSDKLRERYIYIDRDILQKSQCILPGPLLHKLLLTDKLYLHL